MFFQVIYNILLLFGYSYIIYVECENDNIEKSIITNYTRETMADEINNANGSYVLVNACKSFYGVNLILSSY